MGSVLGDLGICQVQGPRAAHPKEAQGTLAACRRFEGPGTVSLDPLQGSVIYAIGVLESRIGGSTFWIIAVRVSS